MTSEDEIGSAALPTSFITSYWRGHGKLWKIYWLYGVLGTWAIGFIAGLAAVLFGISNHLIIAIFLPYNIWIVVSVWRCAFNCNNQAWGYIARFAVVVGFVFLIYKLVHG